MGQRSSSAALNLPQLAPMGLRRGLGPSAAAARRPGVCVLGRRPGMQGARLRGPWLCHPWPCHPWLCRPWLCHLDALQAAGPIGVGINRGLVFSNAGHVAAQLDVKKASAGLGSGWSLGLLYCYNRGNTKGQEPIACGNKILRKSAPFICFLARDYFFR